MGHVVHLLAWVGSSSQQCICFWLVAYGKHFMQGCFHSEVSFPKFKDLLELHLYKSILLDTQDMLALLPA